MDYWDGVGRTKLGKSRERKNIGFYHDHSLLYQAYICLLY